MIEELKVSFPSRRDYEKYKGEISEDALIFIEDENKLITPYKEYQFAKEDDEGESEEMIDILPSVKWEVIRGAWNEEKNPEAVDSKQFVSVNPGQSNNCALRCTFKGCKKITFSFYSDAEPSYAGLIVYKLDNDSTKDHATIMDTFNKQKVWLSHEFETDGEEHFVDFEFWKDDAADDVWTKGEDLAIVYISKTDAQLTHKEFTTHIQQRVNSISSDVEDLKEDVKEVVDIISTVPTKDYVNNLVKGSPILELGNYRTIYFNGSQLSQLIKLPISNFKKGDILTFCFDNYKGYSDYCTYDLRGTLDLNPTILFRKRFYPQDKIVEIVLDSDAEELYFFADPEETDVVLENLTIFYGKRESIYDKVDSLPTFWTGTQDEYDAIKTKDSNTFYFIKEEE